MRGTDSQQDTLFSTVIPELRPPPIIPAPDPGDGQYGIEGA